MRQYYQCTLDRLASPESNLRFIEKCMEDLKLKKSRLKKIAKQKVTRTNQIDLEDAIKTQTNSNENSGR